MPYFTRKSNFGGRRVPYFTRELNVSGRRVPYFTRKLKIYGRRERMFRWGKSINVNLPTLQQMGRVEASLEHLQRIAT